MQVWLDEDRHLWNMFLEKHGTAFLQAHRIMKQIIERDDFEVFAAESEEARKPDFHGCAWIYLIVVDRKDPELIVRFNGM